MNEASRLVMIPTLATESMAAITEESVTSPAPTALSTMSRRLSKNPPESPRLMISLSPTLSATSDTWVPRNGRVFSSC